LQTVDKRQATDWNNYYNNPFPVSHITRRLTSKKVLGLVEGLFDDQAVEIAEFGGGNSFIADQLLNNFQVRRYVVWDTNERAVDQFASRYSGNPNVEARVGDVRETVDWLGFDLIFSIGLIEHFDAHGTQQALENHFHQCRSGGYVLVSFPTPTILYKSIRGFAEVLGMWQFPDERPLHFDEVLGVTENLGETLHRSILWGIGLTQGFGLFLKK